MLDVKMVVAALDRTGKSKGGLAEAMGVRPGAVSEILSGIRLIKATEIAPIVEYLELNMVPIMGRIGAGAHLDLPVDDHLCDRACRHLRRARGEESDEAGDEGNRERHAEGCAEEAPRARAYQPQEPQAVHGHAPTALVSR